MPVDTFFSSSLIGWVTLVTAPVAALWALINFRRSNRNKAAELLLTIEKEYSRQIPALLQIENLADYKKHFAKAIKKSIYEECGPYTREESQAIDQLEAALRHFFEVISGSLLDVALPSANQAGEIGRAHV